MLDLARKLLLTLTDRVGGDRPQLLRPTRQLLEVERRFLDLFEGSGIPMLLFARDTLQILEANAAAEETLGRPQAELLAARLFDLLASDLPRAARAAAGATRELPTDATIGGFVPANRPGAPDPLGGADQAKLRRKDGRPITARIEWFDFRGRAVGMARLAESGMLTPSVRLVRGLLEAAPDAMVVVGRDGTILLVNAQTERLFGYRRDELLGRPLETLVPRRFRSRHISLRAEFAVAPATRGMGKGLQLFGLRKNGTEFPVDIALSSAIHEGQPITISAVRDLSARVETESRMAELVAAVQGAADAIVGVTLDGVIHSWNPAAERLYGWCADNALGRPLAELFPADRAGEPGEILQRIRAGEPLVQTEVALRRGAGEPRHLELTVCAVRDPSGAAVGAAIVARDGSERRRAHHKLDSLRQELDRRVVERTDEVRRSMEELQRFVTTIAHDLQEPVRTMSSFAQLLDRRCRQRLDGEGVELLEYIVEGAGRLHARVDGLRAYAHAAVEPLQRARVPLERALRDAMERLQQPIAESAATVTHGPLPEVLAEPQQMVQLFRHLLDNAVKFRRGGVPPVVRVEARNDRFGHVITMRDNGIGLEAGHLERIFEVFHRLHGRDEYGGAGIGLAVCRRIVERHGGRIWAESVLGDGSCFHFTIPRAEEKS